MARVSANHNGSSHIGNTLPSNTASRAVLERSGFVYAGVVEHAGLSHVLYRCVEAAS